MPNLVEDYNRLKAKYGDVALTDTTTDVATDYERLKNKYSDIFAGMYKSEEPQGAVSKYGAAGEAGQNRIAFLRNLIAGRRLEANQQRMQSAQQTMNNLVGEPLGPNQPLWRRLPANAIMGVEKALPMMIASAISDPVDAARGLVTFLPQQAKQAYRALAPTERTKGYTSPRGDVVLPPREPSVTKEERAAAREAITQDPSGMIFAAMLGGGIIGGSLKAVPDKVKTEVAPTTEVTPTVTLPDTKAPVLLEPSKAPTEQTQIQPPPTGQVVPQAKVPSQPGDAIVKAAKPEPAQPPQPSVTKAVTEQPEGAIGLNKDQIAEIRQELEMAGLPEPEVMANLDVIQRAAQQGLDKKALDIAHELKNSENPSPPSIEEEAGMLLRNRELNKEYREYQQLEAQFLDAGEVERAMDVSRRKEEVFRQIDLLTEGSSKGGTALGRALQFRRNLIAREGMGLPDVLIRLKKAKGKPLTAKEEATARDLVTKYETLLKERDAELAKYQQTAEVEAEKLAQQILQREQAKTKIRKQSQKARAASQERVIDLKKQLRELGFRVNDITGVSSEGAFLIGKLGVEYIKQGMTTIDQVVVALQKDIPELSRRDVLEALVTKDPARQRRAKMQTARQVRELKRQADLLIQIEDAEGGIFREPPKKTGRTQSQEIRRLQKILRDLRGQVYKNKQIKASALERAVKTLNELQDQLDNHYRNIKKKKAPTTEEVKDIQEKIKVLRREMKIEDDLASLNEQMRTGEFVTKNTPVKAPKPPSLERKEVQLLQARRKIKNYEESVKPLGVKGVFGEIVDTQRTLLATADFSALGRQLVVQAFSHPIKTAKLAKTGFGATWSDFSYEKVMKNINDRPHSYLYYKSKLALEDIGGPLSKQNEFFRSRWAERIPGWGHVVRGSNRNMVAMLNLVRSTLFDDFLRANPNATAAEMTSYANWINMTTGRGGGAKLDGAMNLLSAGFFSPRLAASRIQTPYYFIKYVFGESPRLRKAVLRDMTGFVATGLTTLAAAKIAGADVGLDPESSDFGKIKVGNTRFDIWGGFQQPARVILKIGFGVGHRLGYGNKGKLQSELQIDPLETLMRFASYKVAPWLSLTNELATGETVTGEDRSLSQTLAWAVTPLVFQDIYDAWKDGGIGRALLVGPLAAAGVGVNTYKKSDSQAPYEASKISRRFFGNTDSFRDGMEMLMDWNENHPKAPIYGPFTDKTGRIRVTTSPNVEDYTGEPVTQVLTRSSKNNTGKE